MNYINQLSIQWYFCDVLLFSPLSLFECLYFIYLCIFLMFIFERERERDRKIGYEQGRGREREGDTESEVGSTLWAVSTEPNTGLELTDCKIMTWAKVGHSTNWATEVPQSWIPLKGIQLWGRYSTLGSLGGSVGWAADPWFWLRSSSQSLGIEPQVWCGAGCGACLRFSLSKI